MAAIYVGVLEYLQSIVDGYRYRLEGDEQFVISGVARFGEELESLLANHRVDVLAMEPCVPASAGNHQHFPVWPTLSRVFKRQPQLRVLVITGDHGAETVRLAMETGVSGYIYKDDHQSIRSLATVIKSIAAGGVHFSQKAHKILMNKEVGGVPLSQRQMHALSLCAAYPDDTMQQLAGRMSIAPSTFRSTLSTVYRELEVHSRLAAVEEARHRGWLT